MQGVLPDYELIEKTDMVEGRFINPDDQRERRKVAVIGVKVKETLFRPATPTVIGETIEIARIAFTVVGVFEEETEEWRAADHLHPAVAPRSCC